MVYDLQFIGLSDFKSATMDRFEIAFVLNLAFQASNLFIACYLGFGFFAFSTDFLFRTLHYICFFLLNPYFYAQLNTTIWLITFYKERKELFLVRWMRNPLPGEQR